MPSLLFTRRRRWPRRLLKTTGIVLLAAVAVVILSIAINRFDESIEPSTQAWLDYPAPTVPEAQNGYLALMALDAQVANPIVAAAGVVREERAIFADARKSHQYAEPRYQQVRARLLRPRTVRIALDDCQHDCYAYILSHAQLLAQLSGTHADLLQRYGAMLDFPAYAEEIRRDPAALYPNHELASRLDLLYLGNVVAALQQGDAQAAYRQWARHRRFWQMAAAGSVTLRDTLRAIARLERSQALLSGMLTAHPESAAAARLHALPVLAARPRLAPLVARSMVIEFQMQAYVVTDMIAHASLFAIGEIQPAGLGDRLALLFYQRNASLNLLHRLHQSDLLQNGVALDGKIASSDADARIKGPCAYQLDWHLLSNPLGRHLLCKEGSYDLRRYHERAARADQATKELELSIQAVR